MTHRQTLARVLVACATAMLALGLHAQPAPEPTAPRPTAEDTAAQAEREALGQQLAKGAALLNTQPAVAITDYFDKVIAVFEQRHQNEARTVYTARSQAEALMYMVQAATSTSEPKKGAIVVSQSWSDALYLKAYALIELKRLPEAKNNLEAAIAMAPRNSQYLGELANFHIGAGDLQKAFTMFEQAAAAARDFSPPTVKNAELARAWRGMGYVYVERNQLDEAEKIYLDCLALDPKDRRAQGELIYVREQRFKRGVGQLPSVVRQLAAPPTN